MQRKGFIFSAMLAALALAGCSDSRNGGGGAAPDIPPPRLPPERTDSGQVIRPSATDNPSERPAPPPGVIRATTAPAPENTGATTQPAPAP